MCVGCLGAYAVAYGLGDSRWRTSIGLTTLVAGPHSSCSPSVSCPPFLATVPRLRAQAAAAADSAAIARESALAHGSRLHALRRESPRRARRPAYRGRHHRSCRGGQRRRRGVAADLRWPKRGLAASRREAGGARALAGTAAAGGRARRGDSARRDRRQHGAPHTDTTPGPNHARQQRAYTGTPGKTVTHANRKKVLYYSRDVLQLAGIGALPSAPPPNPPLHPSGHAALPSVTLHAPSARTRLQATPCSRHLRWGSTERAGLGRRVRPESFIGSE